MSSAPWLPREEAAQAVSPIRNLTGGHGGVRHIQQRPPFPAHRSRRRLPCAASPGRYSTVGLNSVSVADGVRDGELEAGLVALPVDDRGLQVSDVQWVAEAVYLSRERSRIRETLSIQQVAAAELILPEVRWGDMDPTRRQLLTRAQNAGVSIKPIVEVDSPAAALALAARGVGDTVITLPLAHALGWTKSLYWNSLEPPLYETFAFITRRDAHLSPATQVLIRLAKAASSPVTALLSAARRCTMNPGSPGGPHRSAVRISTTRRRPRVRLPLSPRIDRTDD